MTSRVTKWRRRRRAMELVDQKDLVDGVAGTTTDDGYIIDQFFSFLQPNLYLMYRLNDYSDQNAILTDQSQSKNDGKNLNVSDQASNYFFTDDDEDQTDASDKSDILDDSQVDSMIDESNEAEEEIFNLLVVILLLTFSKRSARKRTA